MNKTVLFPITLLELAASAPRAKQLKLSNNLLAAVEKVASDKWQQAR